MTETGPTPEEFRREVGRILRDLGVALKLVAAMAEGDRPRVQETVAEIAASPRVMYVLSAMAVLAGRLSWELTEQLGEDPQRWLHAAAMLVMDQVDDTLGNGDADG